MREPANTRYGSATAALILIGIGVVFLIVNLRPEFHPWALLEHYWPVLLILFGLGKLWDNYAVREHPGMAGGWGVLGTLIVVLVAVGLAASVAHWGRNHAGGGNGIGRSNDADVHETQSVELQGAQSVTANIQMPAGSLEVSGGSNRLLNVDFSYTGTQEKPKLNYTVANGHGQLDVTQTNDGPSFGRNHDDWNLHFGNGAPIDLSLNMGGGQSEINLSRLNITKLTVNIGAGEMDMDLTGERKNNLEAQIHGGVGSAKVRLPKDIGVRIHATGGIGDVEAHGLKRDGDTYINDAYGKTLATITMNIEGGIGDIKLYQEP